MSNAYWINIGRAVLDDGCLKGVKAFLIFPWWDSNIFNTSHSLSKHDIYRFHLLSSVYIVLNKTACADSSDVLTTPFMLYVWKICS